MHMKLEDIVDGEFEEIKEPSLRIVLGSPEQLKADLEDFGIDAALENDAPQKEITLTRDNFLKALRRMLGEETITRSQMLEMRRRFGITNASFHAKKVDITKKKAKRKLAAKARRVNRQNNSIKGQKRSSGVY